MAPPADAFLSAAAEALPAAAHPPGTGDTQVILRLENVTVSYHLGDGAPPVLSGVHLTVRRGEFVSLIGRSGCGKSTLLKVIAGLLDPLRGRLWLAGTAARRPGCVGYMPQRDCLMPWRTVAENAGLFLELGGLSRSAAARKAEAYLDPFGLAGCGQLYPHQLSGGMRQRVAFLRSLLAGHELILLDEPFGALDALTRAAMREWLLGLWDRLGKTVLFITHDVEEAVLLSDRIVVLGGRPTTVLEDVAVTLPRPRGPHLVTEAAFLQYRKRLMARLRGGEVD